MAKSPAAKKPAPPAGAKAPAARRSAPRAADLGPARVNVLAAHAVPGRYGAVREGGPGVLLSVIHPLSVVTIIARKNRARELALAMQAWLGVEPPGAGGTAIGKGAAVAWAGPDQWVAIAKGRAEGALYDEAAERLQGVASVSDQSHGRIMIRIAGRSARQVLGKGSSVDFHPRAFPVGHCATTQMAHIGIHVTQVENGVFDLLLFRGFAESFWEWLTEMAEEYGYEVR